MSQQPSTREATRLGQQWSSPRGQGHTEALPLRLWPVPSLSGSPGNRSCFLQDDGHRQTSGPLPKVKQRLLSMARHLSCKGEGRLSTCSRSLPPPSLPWLPPPLATPCPLLFLLLRVCASPSFWFSLLSHILLHGRGYPSGPQSRLGMISPPGCSSPVSGLGLCSLWWLKLS